VFVGTTRRRIPGSLGLDHLRHPTILTAGEGIDPPSAMLCSGPTTRMRSERLTLDWARVAVGFSFDHAGGARLRIQRPTLASRTNLEPISTK